MELRNIRTFHWIAELGSFTKAADIQGYTQAAVTLQIKQLEDELQKLTDKFVKIVDDMIEEKSKEILTV